MQRFAQRMSGPIVPRCEDLYQSTVSCLERFCNVITDLEHVFPTGHWPEAGSPSIYRIESMRTASLGLLKWAGEADIHGTL